MPQRRAGLGQRARRARGSSTRSATTPTDRPQPVAVWPAGPRRGARRVRPAARPGIASRSDARRSDDYRRRLRPRRRSVRVAPAGLRRRCRMQLTSPRKDVPVRGAQLTPDRRTLILATDAHRDAGSLRLEAPRPRPSAAANETDRPGSISSRSTRGSTSTIRLCRRRWPTGSRRTAADGRAGCRTSTST